jgi:hypothetical protein
MDNYPLKSKKVNEENLMTATTYYIHSGKVPVASIVLMLAYGLIAAFLLSLVYGYAIAYIPIIYLNFFLTLGFGALTGYAVGMGGKQGKARNPGFYALIGLLVGLVAEYGGWVAWFYASSDQQLLPASPGELWTSIQLVAATGAWSIFGWTPTGFSIYAIWTIEGLMIVGTSTLLAWGFVESTPFCEQCVKWAETTRSKAGFAAIDNIDEFKSQLEQGRIDLVTGLQMADPNSPHSTQVDIHRCNDCDNSCYLSLSSVKVTVDDKGKESKSTDKILTNLKLAGQQYAEIEAIL